MGLFSRLLRRNKAGFIHVRFYDADSGKLLGEQHAVPAQLPESFEAHTMLHLGNTHWDVVEARPVSGAEFRASGELKLVVRKVEIRLEDPSKLLYSLPTICEELPQPRDGSSKLGRCVLEILEDDWRQVEWIAPGFCELIDSELDSVRRVYEHERQGMGFREVHARQAIPAPLSVLGLSLDSLRRSLGNRAAWLEGLSYVGVAGIVKDSFAVRLLSSIELYGLTSEGIIHSICFANIRTNNTPEPDMRDLAHFAATHDLLLVDWCRAQVIPPTEEQYLTYFASARP